MLTSPGETPPRTLGYLLPLAVITAWNPGADRPGLAANRAAHEVLLDHLRRWTLGGAQLTLLRAVGRSADDSHHEEGVAVHGLDLSDAITLGRRMRQAAIFEISFDGARVVDLREPHDP